MGAAGSSGAAGGRAAVNCEDVVLARSSGSGEVFLSTQQRAVASSLREHLFADCAGDSPTSPLLLLARSGAGKSTLLADLARQLRTETPAVLVFSVFVGATDASTSAARFLWELVETIAREGHGQLSDETDVELPAELQAVLAEDAQDLQSLKGSLTAVLKALSDIRGRKVGKDKQDSCGIVLLFDAVNELEHDSRSLTWLPIVLPPGCRYVFSSIEPGEGDAGNAAVRATVVQRWPAVRTVTLGALDGADRAELLRFMLRNDALCASAGIPEVAQTSVAELVLEKPGADVTSPLYLRLAAREVLFHLAFRAKDKHKAPVDFIARLGPDIPALFDAVLTDVDGIADRATAMRFLGSVFASDGGLFLRQLLELTDGKASDERTERGERLKCVVKGRTIPGCSGVVAVGFIHMQARDAVQRHFGLWEGSPELRQVHGQIAEFLGGQYLARRAEQPTSQQALVELKQLLTRYPVHLRLSASDKHLSELSSLLCAGDGMAFCRLKCETGLFGELLNDCRRFALAVKERARAGRIGGGVDPQRVGDWSEFYQANAHVVRMFCAVQARAASCDGVQHAISLAHVLAQQAANTRGSSAAFAPGAGGSGEVVWANKPERVPSVESVVQMPRGIWVWVAASNLARGGTKSSRSSADPHNPVKLALGCSDRLVHVLDYDSGDELVTLQGHTGELSHVLFGGAAGGEGKIGADFLVSVAPTKPHSRDNEVIVWDAGSGQKKQILCARGSCLSCAFSPDSKIFCMRTTTWLVAYACGGSSGSDFSLEELAAADVSEERTGQGVDALLVSGSKYTLATGVGKSVCIFDLDAGAKALSPSSVKLEHGGTIVDARFLYPSAALVACSGDGQVRVWSLETKACLHALQMPEGVDLMSLAVDSPPSSTWRLLACADDKSAHVYEVSGVGGAAGGSGSAAARQLKATAAAPKARQPSAKAPPTKGAGVGASSACSVRKVAVLDGNSSAVKMAEVLRLPESPTEPRAVVCSDDGVARIYRLRPAEESFRASGPAAPAPRAAAKAKGRAAPAKPSPDIFDASAVDASAPPGHQPHAVSACCVVAEPPLTVASADTAGYVCMYGERLRSNADTLWKVHLRSRNESMTAVTSLARIRPPDGSTKQQKSGWVLFAAMYQVVHLLSAATGHTLASCAFPDWLNFVWAGEEHVIAGGDSFILSWASRAAVRALVDGKKDVAWSSVDSGAAAELRDVAVLCVAGAPRGEGAQGEASRTWAVSGCNDNACRVWDLESGGLLAEYKAESWVTSACLLCLEDQRLVIAGTQEGLLHVFGPPDAAPLLRGAVNVAGGSGTVAWCEALVGTGGAAASDLVAVSTSSRMVYVVQVVGAEGGAMGMRRVGYFPAEGPFGSADGVGGQGGAGPGGLLCIGDQSGRLYKLKVAS